LTVKNDILSQIVSCKRERLAASQAALPFAALRAQVTAKPGERFVGALQRDGINIIAEIKRRSPSKGIIRENFDPVEIAHNYTANGAAAISVLTEEDFFGGALDYLRAVREITAVPLLRKDFIFDEYQLWEAAQAGADCILLIAAMLEPAQFNDLLQAAYGLGLDVLVEVHDRAELEKVLPYDVRLLGINNRNLRTFHTTLDTSLQLAADLPKSLTLVSESGLRTRADLDLLREAGFHAFLIGEELMRAPDEGVSLRALIHPPETE
jgi:indole-3-glycerol phosphate synthase